MLKLNKPLPDKYRKDWFWHHGAKIRSTTNATW